MLRDWVRESYCAVAPKGLSEQVSAEVSAKKAPEGQDQGGERGEGGQRQGERGAEEAAYSRHETLTRKRDEACSKRRRLRQDHELDTTIARVPLGVTLGDTGWSCP